MDDFSENKYTSEEVTRIIRRALEMKREETVNHQDLMHTAEELGIDPETIAEAIKKDKAELEAERAQKERLQRKKEGFHRHLWSFIIVNAGLFLINLLTPSPWWFQWPLLGWGIGLALKYRSAYYPSVVRHKNLSSTETR